jgi:hypothetical protein
VPTFNAAPKGFQQLGVALPAQLVKPGYKRVIGGALRSREDACRPCEVKIAVKVLNRMLELGRSVCVRVA